MALLTKTRLRNRFAEEDRQRLRSILIDPAACARYFLRDDPWDLQEQIMRALVSHTSVAVKACHASGKTHSAARLVLWWLLRYKESKIVTTAPTWRQVKLMWDEIAAAAKQSRLPWPDVSATGLRLGDDHYAVGLSTNDPTKFHGYHSPNILVIGDEATGILGSIFDAIEGIRAGGNARLLLLGNPTVPAGKFYEVFTRERAAWKLFTISAFQTPNFAGVNLEQLVQMTADELDTSVAPYLVTRRWVYDAYHRWGPNHPMFSSRVLGEFPAQSETSVYSLEWIERSAADPPALPDDGQVRTIQVGIDVAGPGEDETALCARIGSVVIMQRAWAKPDPRGDILSALSELRLRKGTRIGHVVVDVVGMGYYLAQHIADVGYDVRGFNAGGAPIDRENFHEAKTEAYWCLREYLSSGVAGMTDEECQAQLATVQYSQTSAGKLKIESKEEARKRGQSSPDRAEAAVMAFVNVRDRERILDLTSQVRISPV